MYNAYNTNNAYNAYNAYKSSVFCPGGAHNWPPLAHAQAINFNFFFNLFIAIEIVQKRHFK